MGPSGSFQWTTEAKIAASLILLAKLMIFRENPAKSPWEKSAKVYLFSYSSRSSTAGGVVNLRVSEVSLQQ